MKKKQMVKHEYFQYRYNDIDKITAGIIKELGIKCPIFDIEDVVNRLGGKIVYNLDIQIGKGSYLKKTGESSFEIGLTIKKYDKNINYKVAYELGNLFLHTGFLSDVNKWQLQPIGIRLYNTYGYQEFNANAFASAFLMPKIEYEKKLNEAVIDKNNIDICKVAKYFSVSTNAASTRGKWLGLLKW